MKVSVAKPFVGFSGKLSELVYYIDKFTGTMYCRDYVVPHKTINNTNLGNRTKNLSLFYAAASPGWVSDIKNYADRLNIIIMGHGTRLNGFSMLLKLMYILGHAIPDLDLRTVTIEEIIERGIPITTIREAVEAGIIPMVPRFEELINQLVTD